MMTDYDSLRENALNVFPRLPDVLFSEYQYPPRDWNQVSIIALPTCNRRY